MGFRSIILGYSRRVFFSALFFMVVISLGGCFSGVRIKKAGMGVYGGKRVGSGLIYFFRERDRYGANTMYEIKRNGEVIGGVGNGTYFFVFTEAGTNTYTAETEAGAALGLEVEAGKTYYIRCGLSWGLLEARPVMEVVGGEAGAAMVARLKYGVIEE